MCSMFYQPLLDPRERIPPTKEELENGYSLGIKFAKKSNGRALNVPEPGKEALNARISEVSTQAKGSIQNARTSGQNAVAPWERPKTQSVENQPQRGVPSSNPAKAQDQAKKISNLPNPIIPDKPKLSGNSVLQQDLFLSGFGNANASRALEEAERIEARDKATRRINDAFDELSRSGDYLRDRNDLAHCQKDLYSARSDARYSIQQAYKNGHSTKEIAQEAIKGTIIFARNIFSAYTNCDLSSCCFR